MKHKILSLIVALLLTLPMVTVAQDDAAPPDIVGTYTYTGAYGDETYDGTTTISGAAPFYTLSYLDETESGETFEETVQGLAQGNTLVTVLDDAECSPGTLTRRSDGVLIGTWIDTYTGAVVPLGIEVYTPQNETTGFVGTYDLKGMYATGAMYTAVLEIVENEKGWLDLTWHFDSDEGFPEDVPYINVGIGMVNGNILGYSVVDGESIECGVFVAQFSGDSYEAVWVDGDYIPGTESGARAE